MAHEQRDFLLRACHDLRTPLRAVRTNAELLARHPERRDGPDFDQMLGFLVDGARTADAVVNGLANYAIALSVQPSPLPVSTGVLLQGALAKLASDISACQAAITCGELPRAVCDPDRVMQLFENLVRNAIEHGKAAPPAIHVSAREHSGEWLFSVCDNGCGIAAEDLERVFRPFERLRKDREGAGLGLAICREIVQGHGGRIWAESAPGNGAAFYFTMPME